MMKALAVGFCAGAAATWSFKDSIPVQIDTWTSGIRRDLARRLRVVADAIEGGLTGTRAGPAEPGAVAAAAKPVVQSVRSS